MKRAFIALSIALLSSPHARAAETPAAMPSKTEAVPVSADKSSATVSIAPAKKAFILELIKLNGDSQDFFRGMNTVLNTVQTSFMQGAQASIVKDPTLNEDQKNKAIQAVGERYSHILDRMKELLKQQVDIEDLRDSLLTEIYDKYYTEDDLRKIVEFYKSPVGRKMVTQAPTVAQDAIAITQERLGPIIRKIVEQLKTEFPPDGTTTKP